MNLILSTCGTSVLTNLADPAVRRLVADYANEKTQESVPVDHHKQLIDLIDTAKSKLKAADVVETKRASAELNGILSLAGNRTPLDSKDDHVLIHTDTWLGTAAAEVIQVKLKTYGVTPQLERIPSLNTRSRSDFDAGLRRLVKWAAETLPGYRQARYKVIFNLVGGFKSVQGFMQTLGMFYADEIVYIFETGGELLRIPRLPVDLDSAARKVMTDHACLFRRLDVLGPQPSSVVPSSEIPESMLEHAGDITDLSPWGTLLWNAFKDSLYKTQLLESPSTRVGYSEVFMKDAQNLERDRYSILNERIDDLMRYMEEFDRPNPKRLDVKQLKGNHKPATHEADAWHDADCRRILLHYDNGVAVLDRLSSPLHK